MSEEAGTDNHGAKNDDNNGVKERIEKVAFYKLFTFADRLDLALMIVGTVASVANGMTQPLMTLIFGHLINTLGTTPRSHVVHEVSKVSLLFLYLAIGSGIASLLQMSCWMVTGERQAGRIRGLYLKTILKQDIAFFDTQTTTGEVIGRMSGDTVLIQDAMGEKVGKCIQLSSTFVGGFVIAFVRGWRLTLVLIACVPAIVAAGVCMSMIMAKASSKAQIAYARAADVVEQSVGSIRTVASFTGEKRALHKYCVKVNDAYICAVHQGFASGFGLGSMLLIVFSTYGLAVWYGGKLIVGKGYNGGEVINVIMAIMTGGLSLGQASPCFSAFAAGQAAAYKMFKTISRKPSIDSSNTSGDVPEDITGEIELKDVYFKYPSRPDVQIFSGFSLHIPSGKTVALVGQSGSGKSTVISLLERFYDPDAGEVLIDGINIKRFQLKWLRDNMGLVSQEPVLFASSIRENILYGKKNANNSEVRKAIELANAANFIDSLPNGLDTIVGEHGTHLSGGQKQRIAISRAILKSPKILLLDEATSALDAESERVVQDALENVMTNRTTVVVAHRLSTIRNADLIAVVNQGKLIEQGIHSELIKDKDGAYSQLLHMQEGKNAVGDSNGVDSKKVETTPSSEYEIVMSSSEILSEKRSLSIRSARHSFSLNIEKERRAGVPEEQNVEEASRGSSKKISFRRLAILNKPELPFLLLGSVAASVNGVIFPLFGLLLSKAIRIFYEPFSELKKDSRFWALMYVGLGFVSLCVIPVQNGLFGIAGGRLIRRIRSLSFEKVVHQEISWFDDPANSSGAVGARLSTDASIVRSLVGDALALIVQNVATVIAGLVIAFTANWILAIIILLVLPFFGLQGYLQMKFLHGFSADSKKMYEEASQVANDAVGGIRTVASFCAEEKVMEMYQKKCEGPMRQGVRLGIVSGAGFGFGSFAQFCANSFCFYIGAILVQHGRATFGEVFKVFFALIMSAIGLSQSSAMAPDISKAKASCRSIFEILDSKPKIDSSADEGTTLATLKGDIEFRNISFKYPTRPDVPIFRDLSITMPSGKTMALVGESGSGKSTVISLMERFYDPDSGNIFLDQVNIKTLKLSWLREQMGLVSQEPILFNETIRDNISYGKQGTVTEEEIIEAAKAANAHNFIAGLPQGYDTNAGERGVQLSGGQKQRIAIARAILKDPKILLLDEATSALDTESERVVQDALDKVMVNRTTIVVAHRLSTIRGADMISVVKNGVIAESGSHDTLMNIEHGVYASLVALQMTSSSS